MMGVPGRPFQETRVLARIEERTGQNVCVASEGVAVNILKEDPVWTPRVKWAFSSPKSRHQTKQLGQNHSARALVTIAVAIPALF